MARQPRLIEDAEPEILPVTETITYLPGEGDKPFAIWCGHKFDANVPKEIKGHAAGTQQEKLNAHLIERARDNKHFRVGNAKAKRDPVKTPTTPEEYRAYAVEWIKDPAIQHADDLIGRLAKDRELRTVCEVGSDDYAWLSTLFMPKLHELSKGDELTDGQVAALWVQHGFNELPW